jgi:hypothetical protein
MHLQQGRLMEMRKSKATVKAIVPMEDKEPAPVVTVPANTIPSELALRHQAQIQVLETEFKGIKNDLEGIRDWMRSIQNEFREFSNEVRNYNAKKQERNPMVYIGLASLCFVMLGMASGLTIFTINALHTPTRERVELLEKQHEARDAQWKSDFEMIIRLDERVKASVNGQ